MNFLMAVTFSFQLFIEPNLKRSSHSIGDGSTSLGATGAQIS